MAEGRAPKADDLFALAYSTLFEVVKIARKEEHWSLSKEEANKLGKVSVNCLNTVPAVTKAKIEQRFNRWLPWVSLVSFGFVITYPRVIISLEQQKRQKLVRFPVMPRTEESGLENETFGNAPGAPGNAPQSVDGKQSNFPPGVNPNLPPFDFKIPS